jgi:leader peptidase (prepilin peptidase)/N-methyltransferase
MGILELPTFLALVAFAVGSTIGSFLNVVIYRVPRELSVNDPKRSFCPSCKYLIPFYHNIPLVSWLFLGGKCKNCRGKISIRYWYVELLTALLFVAAWFAFGWNYEEGMFRYPALVPVVWILLAMFIAATFIDIEHQIIPDGITVGGMVVGLLAAFAVPVMASELMGCMPSGFERAGGIVPRLQALGWSAAGAAAGYGLLYAVVVLGKIAFGKKDLKLPENAKWKVSQENDDDNPTLTAGGKLHSWEELYFVGSERVQMQCSEVELNGARSKDATVQIWVDKVVVDGSETPLSDIKSFTGRSAGDMRYHREAMGFGDVKFMAMIGAFIGWQGILFTLLAASVLGTAMALPARILGKGDSAFARIPFGPYLALGATIWVFYGTPLVEWYFGLLRPAGY